MPSVSATVLQLLACPVCRQALQASSGKAGEVIVCVGCGRRYPVIDGIPALIPERASLPEAD